MNEKYTIGVDLDGVCGRYYEALRQYLGEQNGIPPEKIADIYPDPTTYDMHEWPDMEQNFIKYHSDAVQQGLFAHMQPMPGASDALWKLNESGFHLRVITSRFVRHGQNAQVISDTAFWLDQHQIPYRDIMFVKDKADVYADIYIDDSPENVVRLQETGRDVIIFDAPYNRELAGYRANNWDDVLTLINQLAK
jgi:5'(3')-deoxyribonucleotidase